MGTSPATPVTREMWSDRESSNCTERVWQQEVTNESPPDHASDQEDEEDEENSSEVNRKADQMEFIKEFQEIVNEAIDRLLKKPVRKHSHQKDKPEPHMEQGKHNTALAKVTWPIRC